MTAERRAFLEGIRDVLPMLLGIVPFGLITGVSAVGAGLHPFDVVLMSALVFAGAAQLAAISLIAAGAAGWAAVLTVAMVNLRHLMYSLALTPWLRRYGLLSRALVSFLMALVVLYQMVARLRGGAKSMEAASGDASMDPL